MLGNTRKMLSKIKTDEANINCIVKNRLLENIVHS